MAIVGVDDSSLQADSKPY